MKQQVVPGGRWTEVLPTAQSAEATAGAPDVIIKVDLDERAFLFPAQKVPTQLQLHVYRPHRVRIECAFAFNESRTGPELIEMGADDLRELTKKLVEAIYKAQTSHVITNSLNVSINVVANGYILQFNRHAHSKELFLGTGCIWRVCSSLVRAVDFLSPIASN